MRTNNGVAVFPLLIAFVCCPLTSFVQARPSDAAIDAEVGRIMKTTGARGMAVAVIDRGKVRYVRAYGIRNAKGEPLTTDTIMYGASLTKTVFAYTVMRLVEQRKLQLDTPLARYLEKPLPSYGPDPIFPDKYGPYRDLAGDSRWEKITARMCLTHSTGFSNFWFIEPDRKLRIHFEPGTRYAYSGEGFILLQFVIERGRREHGLGLDVGDFDTGNLRPSGDDTDQPFGAMISLSISPTAGMIRDSRRNMTIAVKYGRPVQWTRPLPT
jgi:CubicO group peptidase (beta-lactamase class C family)